MVINLFNSSICFYKKHLVIAGIILLFFGILISFQLFSQLATKSDVNTYSQAATSGLHLSQVLSSPAPASTTQGSFCGPNTNIGFNCGGNLVCQYNTLNLKDVTSEQLRCLPKSMVKLRVMDDNDPNKVLNYFQNKVIIHGEKNNGFAHRSSFFSFNINTNLPIYFVPGGQELLNRIIIHTSCDVDGNKQYYGDTLGHTAGSLDQTCTLKGLKINTDILVKVNVDMWIFDSHEEQQAFMRDTNMLSSRPPDVSLGNVQVKVFDTGDQ